MLESKSRIVLIVLSVVVLIVALCTAFVFVTMHKDTNLFNKGFVATSKTGQIVINPQFDGADAFSEGLAAVRIGDDKTGKWGYIDKAGKYVINPQFDSADVFIGDMAAVRIGDDKTGKWGYIDKAGKYVINPQFDSADRFAEDAEILDVNPLRAIDEEGNLIEDWTKLACSQQCLALVGIGDSATRKYGYIDKAGKYAINPQFDAASDKFTGGLVAVRTGDPARSEEHTS